MTEWVRVFIYVYAALSQAVEAALAAKTSPEMRNQALCAAAIKVLNAGHRGMHYNLQPPCLPFGAMHAGGYGAGLVGTAGAGGMESRRDSAVPAPAMQAPPTAHPPPRKTPRTGPKSWTEDEDRILRDAALQRRLPWSQISQVPHTSLSRAQPRRPTLPCTCCLNVALCPPAATDAHSDVRAVVAGSLRRHREESVAQDSHA